MVSSLVLCLQHAAPDLVELDRLEQGAEIALAEALVAAALDDLEKDRADHRLGEYLQQEAIAMVGREIFLDLRLVVGALVDRDADLAARAGHRLRLQARELALDVEVADLPEIEEAFV